MEVDIMHSAQDPRLDDTRGGDWRHERITGRRGQFSATLAFRGRNNTRGAAVAPAGTRRYARSCPLCHDNGLKTQREPLANFVRGSSMAERVKRGGTIDAARTRTLRNKAESGASTDAALENGDGEPRLFEQSLGISAP
jgi:hypothetical protein